MTVVATGPTPALSNGAGGFQVGPGLVSEPILGRQGAAADFTGAATLTAADLTTGIVNYVGAGHSLTLPTAAALDTAFPNAGVNSSFEFSVIATTGTATLVTNTGWTIVGRLTTAAATASRYRARKTGGAAWTLYLIG